MDSQDTQSAEPNVSQEKTKGKIGAIVVLAMDLCKKNYIHSVTKSIFDGNGRSVQPQQLLFVCEESKTSSILE